MGKRQRTENEDGNTRKKSRNRIIIYSSSDEEESNRSNSQDKEPVAGPSHDVTDQITSPIAVRDEHIPTCDEPSATPTGESAESEELDANLLLLLGEAPEDETTLGKAIHKDIASRWLDVLKKGLSKESKDKLAKEYLIPSNCELLVPPLLNPEAKAAMTEVFINRDASLMYRQKQTSNAIAALAQAMEAIISKKCDQEFKQQILKPVNDACKILCDMHHAETQRRRKFVIASVNTGMKETLASSGTDKFLFGSNMSEKLKAAQTVQKSGETLKQKPNTQFHKSNFYYKNQSYYNKNRTNSKPLHQRNAGKQDAGRTAPASRYQSSSSSSNRPHNRAPARARSPQNPPPPRRTYRR